MQARVGLVSGDHMYAMIGLYASSSISFGTHAKLVDMEATARQNVDQMNMYKQELFITLQLLILEFVLVVSGKADDPVVVDGLLASTESTVLPDGAFMTYCLLYKMIIAYIFGDFHVALDMADKSRAIHTAKAALRDFSLRIHSYFFDAMTCLAAAPSLPKRRRQLVSIARVQLKKLRTFANHNPQDGLHMVHLVEAELDALGGNRENAMSNYNLAIDSSKKVNFLHVQALACERAGVALQRLGEMSLAREHLDQASKLYHEWGAMAKVEQMRTNNATG
jgi:hypothetical protein